MSKFIKVDDVPGLEPRQSEISDELAALWISNGNQNIADQPWPGLPLVEMFIVTDEQPVSAA